MAQGIQHTAEFIMGKQESLHVIAAYTPESLDFKKKLYEMIEKYLKEGEVIVLTDLFGGSVNNEAMSSIAKYKNVFLVAGVNLSLVTQLLASEGGSDIKGLIKKSIKEAKEGIIFCNELSGCEDSYLMYFMLALRLYKNLGYFPQYDRWADQMGNLHTNLVRIREEFEPRAAKLAEKYSKGPYTMFVGSGILWGETYLFSMCILEEMQWVRTKSVKSADFFHGPLELVEKGLPVFLIMGEDEYRPLDERVEHFARKFTDKLEVFDTKEFQLTDIDDEFRVIVSPMIVTAILTERLAVHYELNTGHSLKFRRYYRQFEY